MSSERSFWAMSFTCKHELLSVIYGMSIVGLSLYQKESI